MLFLSLSFAVAVAQRGQQDFWDQVLHHGEDLDRQDPGLLSPIKDEGKTEEKKKDPALKTEKDYGHGHGHDDEHGDADSSVASIIGGGIAGFLGFLAFLARLYQRFRQIRRAGEGYGELFLDIFVALMSFFHRDRAPAIEDV